MRRLRGALVSRTSRERYTALRQSAWRHPKVRKCSKGARSLWFMSLSYVPDFETDGVVPAGAVSMLDGTPDEAAELVNVGLWRVHGDDYVVNAYLSHNPSHEDLEAVRESRRLAGAKGGRSKANRVANATAPDTANDVASASQVLQQMPSKTVAESESESESDPDHEQGSPPIIIGSPQARVARIIAGPATPQRAWQLLEAIAELHPGSNGRPVASPGLMPSENDKTKLGKLLGTIQGEEPLGYVASEWLALLSLIDAGEIEPPKGPMVPYFIACFGRMEDRRRKEGVPHLPARTEAAA